jgi:hypothetical protein
MVNNFLIAFATAIGSALVLLSLLYLGVRIFAPRKLDERIPISVSVPALIPIQEPTAFTTVIPGLPSYGTSYASNLRGLLTGSAILTDVAMPNISGLEVADQLKRISQLGHTVPMFILTAQHVAETMGPYRSKAIEAQEPPPVRLSLANAEAVTH